MYDLTVSFKKGVQHVAGAAFYQKGHALRLISAGCSVPFPLRVEHLHGEGVTICLYGPDGRQTIASTRNGCIDWMLTRLHGRYWDRRADEACGPSGGGLQPQGCHWHLDTRPDKHRKMPSSAWRGRLKLAARVPAP